MSDIPVHMLKTETTNPAPTKMVKVEYFALCGASLAHDGVTDYPHRVTCEACLALMKVKA